jgi:hypothetical protein
MIYEPKAQTLSQPLVVFLPTEPELIMTTAWPLRLVRHDAKSRRCFARALRPSRTITDRDDCASLKCI